jgi:hypothetical protein
MKNFSIFALASLTLAISAGCINSPVSSYAVKPSDSPAKDLTEARKAILENKASLSGDFYSALRAANPSNPEAALMDAAIFLEKKAKEVGNIGPDFKPGQVLKGLVNFQSSLSKVVEAQKEGLTRVLPALATPFEPYSLGSRHWYEGSPAYEEILDQAGLYAFATELQLGKIGSDAGVAVNLSGVDEFDGGLEAIKKSVYDAHPECSKTEDPYSKKNLLCVNEVLEKGLNLLLHSSNPKISSLFTLSDDGRKAMRESYDSFKKLITKLKELSLARPALANSSSYYIYGPDFKSKTSASIFDCLEGPCQLNFHDRNTHEEKEPLILDVSNFLKNAPNDLRKLMPKHFEVKEALFSSSHDRDIDSTLEAIQLVDPTLGGLFPNGDLIEKLKGSEEAGYGLIYFVLITAWAFPTI